MSLQKIKSAKNITLTDRYSRNTVLNGLIKTKLEAEMIHVKQNFAKILTKQPELNSRTNPPAPIVKRTKSSISLKNIQEAVHYDPILNLTQVQQFVASRQLESFLIPVIQLAQIHEAREQHMGLHTKCNQNTNLVSKNDVLSLPSHDLTELSSKVKAATVREYSEDVWLPSKPEVAHLLQNKKEQIEENISGKGKNQSKDIQIEFDKLNERLLGSFNVHSSRAFETFPLDNFLHLKTIMKPTTYSPQKYHKNDYKLIDSWLTSTIEVIAKEKKNQEDKLNLVYTAYICVWKELIRLTYIEFEEKGLILEKMFYSMLRLFWGIISEQQSLARSYVKDSENEHNQIKKMMEHRMDELNRRHVAYSEESQILKENNYKLSKMVISFQKVNRELIEELEKVTRQKKQCEYELSTVNSNFFKTLDILHKKKLISMDEIENPLASNKLSISYRTYIVIDDNSNPIVLGRFKTDANSLNVKPRYSSQAMQETDEARKYNERYGITVKQLDNSLNQYWEKKQDDLEMRGILNILVSENKIKDFCGGSQKIEYVECGFQFPQNDENHFEKLLKDIVDQLNHKFDIERAQIEQQMMKKEQQFNRWKASAEELLDKNKSLHEINLKNTENLKKAKEGANELVKEIEQLARKNEQLEDQIHYLNRDLITSKAAEELAKVTEKNVFSQKEAMKVQLEREKENNRMLIRGNLEYREKTEKLEIKFNTLHNSLKLVAPWLEKLMMETEKPLEEISVALLREVSLKIENNLSEYVAKDSSLFMTRLG